MRASLAASWIAAVMAAVAGGCCALAVEEPSPLYQVTMSSGCAPYDAPSTELRLEAVEGQAWVFFNLWPDEGVVGPSVIRFGAERPIGQGAYCTGPETCEPAEGGGG